MVIMWTTQNAQEVADNVSDVEEIVMHRRGCNGQIGGEAGLRA